jgi:hypothetical protein
MGEQKKRLDSKVTCLGSKKCKRVGMPGKQSWPINIGVSRRASRSSVSMVFPRSAYRLGKADKTKKRRMRKRGKGKDENQLTYRQDDFITRVILEVSETRNLLTT